MRENFTKAVLQRTGFTEKEWKDYWESMVEFRNKYIVHRDKFRGKVPFFDKALEVAYAYDDWIRDCFPGIWEEPPFQRSAEGIRENIRHFIEDFIRKQ